MAKKKSMKEQTTINKTYT